MKLTTEIFNMTEKDAIDKMSNYNSAWNKNHERPSKVFFDMMKNRGCKKTITRLKREDGYTTEMSEIVKEMHQFFHCQDLF